VKIVSCWYDPFCALTRPSTPPIMAYITRTEEISRIPYLLFEFKSNLPR
jgi:hypothetical protein